MPIPIPKPKTNPLKKDSFFELLFIKKNNGATATQDNKIHKLVFTKLTANPENNAINIVFILFSNLKKFIVFYNNSLTNNKLNRNSYDNYC